ncbi:EndoU domain-containing protein [Bacillus cereus]
MKLKCTPIVRHIINNWRCIFPKDWNRVQVVDSIKEAYTNRVQIAPNKYVGQTSSGFKVEMIIENGEITTAYPKYTRR